jgi:hypothetical protein
VRVAERRDETGKDELELRRGARGRPLYNGASAPLTIGWPFAFSSLAKQFILLSLGRRQNLSSFSLYVFGGFDRDFETAWRVLRDVRYCTTREASRDHNQLTWVPGRQAGARPPPDFNSCVSSLPLTPAVGFFLRPLVLSGA